MSESKVTPVTITDKTSQEQYRLLMSILLQEAVPVFMSENKTLALKKALKAEGNPQEDTPDFQETRTTTIERLSKYILKHITFEGHLGQITRTMEEHIGDLVKKHGCNLLRDVNTDKFPNRAATVAASLANPPNAMNSTSIVAQEQSTGKTTSRSEVRNKQMISELEDLGFSEAFATEFTARLAKEHPYAYCSPAQISFVAKTAQIAAKNIENPTVDQVISNSNLVTLLTEIAKQNITGILHYVQTDIDALDQIQPKTMVHLQDVAKALGVNVSVQSTQDKESPKPSLASKRQLLKENRGISLNKLPTTTTYTPKASDAIDDPNKQSHSSPHIQLSSKGKETHPRVAKSLNRTFSSAIVKKPDPHELASSLKSEKDTAEKTGNNTDGKHAQQVLGSKNKSGDGIGGPK